MIDDALNCLFNAFDLDRTGKITYKKMCTGLTLLCDRGPNPEELTMFSRGSELTDNAMPTRPVMQDQRQPARRGAPVP